MTITAQTAKTGPYNGNGSTTTFSYTFKVSSAAHLVVTVLGTDGSTESVKVLNTDYTVTGVGSPSGGTIVMGTAPVTGEKLTITRNVTLDQEVDLQNRGAVNPETLEESLDKLTQISQDQQEQLDRSLKVDLFEQADLDQLTINVNALAAISTQITTVAGISGNVTTVAGIDTEVTTVAGISSDVTTVAGISSDVTAVVADEADIGTVATNIADVNTVAGISANVTTVAGISSDVTAVAGDATDIGTVATNIANVNTVAGISGNVTTVAGISADVTAVAGDATDIGTVATNIANVNTVAGISANVMTVAGISANVTAVAADATDIGTVATNITNVNTVAGISANVTTVAGISADVTAVAGDATDIGTVATNIADINTAATNIAAIIAAPTEAANASASATSAANSAAAAAASFDSFDDRYLGVKASDPTLDNDGNPLVSGALYFSSSENIMKVYDGASWIAATSAGNVSFLQYEYTATLGQTTFSGADDNSATLSYTVANLIVTLNGVVLDNGGDYTATNGTSVVLTSGAAAGDLLQVIAFKSFTVADMVPASTGGTFAGNVAVTGDLTIADKIIHSGDTDTAIRFPAADTMTVETAGSERVRIDSSGNVGIGTSSPYHNLQVTGTIKAATGNAQGILALGDGSGSTNNVGLWRGAANAPTTDGNFLNLGGYDGVVFATGAAAIGSQTERARIDASGRILVGTTSTDLCNGNTVGIGLGTTQNGTTAIGTSQFSSSGNAGININRKSDDGNLVTFYQDGSLEGTISVSGTAVSYNGGHLARWSQTADNTRIDILRGTVLTNLDQMAVWIDPETGAPQDNEQLNCTAVSSVEGDPNVAGVFVNWDNDDDGNDMNIAMTGDFIIRIAQGTTVQRGDLLMSAGDGTAKPQGDDIIRSKTIAKVTSTHVTCTYEDGSYCVPCVLMAC
jgi:hypothetical protein